MRTCLALFVLAPFALTPQEDAVKKELAQLNGVWQIDTFEEDQNAGRVEYWRTIRLVFKGDRLVFEGDEVLSKKAASIKLTIHPDGMPKGIDLEIIAGAEKGVLMEGIYQLKDGELKLCLRTDGVKNRPLEFTTTPGSNRTLIVLKRAK